MRRTLTKAEMQWAQALHANWVLQCEAEGMPVPPEPIDSVIQAAHVGFCRLNEAKAFAIDQAQAEKVYREAHGCKAN